MSQITKETRLISYITRPTSLKKQIYDALDKPMTLRELSNKLGWHVTRVRPRATELEQDGFIESFTSDKDMATKRPVAVYRRVE